MPGADEGERLREALHELGVLRERERAAHAETRALLECVQAYATAPNATAAIRALLAAIARVTGASRVLVVGRQNGATSILLSEPDPAAADGAKAPPAARPPPAAAGGEGRAPEPPVDLFARSRNLADLSMVGGWPAAIDPAPHRSLLATPIPGPGARAVCALHLEAGGFSRAHLALLERLAPLLRQALAAEAMAQDRALLAAVVAGSPLALSIADASHPDRPVVYVNEAQSRLSGAPPEALRGRPLASVVAPPPRQRDPETAPADAAERAMLTGAVAAGLQGRYQLRAGRQTGADCWAEVTLYPVGTGVAGHPRHLVATQTDITDRVVAERDRDRLRIRLTAALAVTGDAFLIVSSTGEVLFANAALADAMPAPGPGWATGTTLAENLHAFRGQAGPRPADPPPGPDDLRLLAATGAGRELRLPDGRSFLVRARSGEDGTLVVTAADITRLKTVEAQMRARVAAIEAARDGIILVNAAERIVYLNRAAADLLGFDRPDHALGRDWRRTYTAPETALARAVLARRTDAAGRIRTHEITRSPLPDDCTLQRGAVLIVRDATERLAEEQRQADLRAALARAHRQEALTQLAGDLAHDFTNLLATIGATARSVATAAQGLGPAGAPLARSARRIEEARTQAKALVARLRDLGTHARGGRPVDLRERVARLREAAGAALPPGARLDIDAGPAALPVDDPEEAADACLQLARIALLSDGGDARLRLSRAAAEQERPLEAGFLSPGRAYAVVEITAPASVAPIPPPPRDESRLPESGPERALALLALQARAVGGRLERDQTAEGGPALRLYWPLSARAGSAEPSASPRPGGPSLSGATLLVVDRDQETGEVLHAFLDALGAEVALCDSAAIAAEALREEPAGWTAVIADEAAGGAEGADTVVTLHDTAPDLPLFLLTERELAPAEGARRAASCAGVFTKPVDLAALAERLAALSPGTENRAEERTKDGPEDGMEDSKGRGTA